MRVQNVCVLRHAHKRELGTKILRNWAHALTEAGKSKICRVGRHAGDQGESRGWLCFNFLESSKNNVSL